MCNKEKTLRKVHINLENNFSFDCQRSKSQGMFKNISSRILEDVRKEQVVRALIKEPKKSRKLIFKEWFNDKVHEFCIVTSLHGYGKFVEYSCVH